jgi:hypothetical protein
MGELLAIGRAKTERKGVGPHGTPSAVRAFYDHPNAEKAPPHTPLASAGGGCGSTGSVTSRRREPMVNAKPRPSGEKTMELGPGLREGTQGSGLTLQANASRSDAVPGPKGQCI